jgi:transposase
MGRISKMGDRYLRRLLVVGMTSLVRRARAKPNSVDPRIAAMLARKPARVVTVAAANRAARVAWSIIARGGPTARPPAWPHDSLADRRKSASGGCERDVK